MNKPNFHQQEIIEKIFSNFFVYAKVSTSYFMISRLYLFSSNSGIFPLNNMHDHSPKSDKKNSRIKKVFEENQIFLKAEIYFFLETWEIYVKISAYLKHFWCLMALGVLSFLLMKF